MFSRVQSHRLSLRSFFTLLFTISLTSCGLTGHGGFKADAPVAQYHRFAAGDSLTKLARQYRTSKQSLLLLNGLLSESQIAKGDRLFVGYRGGPATRHQPVEVAGRVKLLWPVQAKRISSVFGPRWSSFHDGIDFAARTGTSVLASHDGVVRYAGSKLSGYGKMVIIDGYEGLTTIYAHNSRLLVTTGQRVLKGEKISEVGSTGRSTGPHLHFEVRSKDRRGRYVALDPLPILQGSKVKPRFRVNESLRPRLAKR